MSKDALGGDIVVGAFYGFHQYNNGVAHNSRCYVLEVVAEKARVRVKRKFVSVYSGAPEEEKVTRPNIAIKCNTLFRLYS